MLKGEKSAEAVETAFAWARNASRIGQTCPPQLRPPSSGAHPGLLGSGLTTLLRRSGTPSRRP